MKKHLLILSIGLLLFGTSCSKDDDKKEIYVRVENASKFEFYEIVLEMNADNIFNYQNLGVGEKSEYRKFDFASNMPNAIIDIDRNVHKFLYNDDLGYNEFDSGYYTFKISTFEGINSGIGLDFEIIVD